MGSPLHLARTPVSPGGATPLLGQHTREILVELGLSVEEVDAMLASGAAVEHR